MRFLMNQMYKMKTYKKINNKIVQANHKILIKHHNNHHVNTHPFIIKEISIRNISHKQILNQNINHHCIN